MNGSCPGISLRECRNRGITGRWPVLLPAAIYTRGDSYGIKHIAEREKNTYITNGAFIAAAIAEGFQIKRAGSAGADPNVFLNISPEVANERER